MSPLSSCAAQNGLDESLAKGLADAGCYCVSEGANIEGFVKAANEVLAYRIVQFNLQSRKA